MTVKLLYLAAWVFTTATTVLAAPGTLFHPVNHCRVFDSRIIPRCRQLNGACAPVAAGSVVAIDFSLPDNTLQGGEGHDCGVAASAGAVLVRISAADSWKPGFVRAWSPATDEPLVSQAVEYFGAGQVSETAVVILSLATANFGVNESGTALFVDVQGWYD